MKSCRKCGATSIAGVEYPHDHPQRYDGISEWQCLSCGYREGRWSLVELKNEDFETRLGIRKEEDAR